MGHESRQHFLLDRRAGWRAAILERAVLAECETEIQLAPLPGAAKPLVDAAGTFGGLVSPIGLALDGEGRIYILENSTASIKLFDPCSATFRVLPCVGGIGSEARQLRAPKGLAISSRNDLYVADTGNRRVQVFSLRGLALRAIWGPFKVDKSGPQVKLEAVVEADEAANVQDECAPSASLPTGLWEPSDIALSCRNWAYICDYANGLIHVFDAQGCWRAAYDGASDEEEQPPLVKPTRLALDREGRIYILQEGESFVTVLDKEGKFLTRVTAPDELKEKFCPTALAVDGEGHLHLSERFTGCLYIYLRDEEGTYSLKGACRSVAGTCADLVFDLSGNAVLADASSGKLVQHFARAVFNASGVYVSEQLDSRTYKCVWHRVLMRAVVPVGTQIEVETLTSEASKTTAEIESLPDSRWTLAQTNSTVGDGEWDCLVQSPPGRFLWLRLTLKSDGLATPAIRQVRVYFPRSSSLQYLPAVYQDDVESREFLDQFLSVFDTLRDGIGERLTNIASYFDPLATPANGAGPGGTDFLSWLASWLGLSLDRHWPEAKRRRLLKEAHRLYALRGTPAGLRLHIELYTGREPRILEHFKLRRWLFVDHARLGEQSTLWGDEVMKRLQLDVHSRIGTFQLIDYSDPVRDPFYRDAYQFTVFVPAGSDDDETARQTLERIIEMAKPAQTMGHLELLKPRFRVGVQAFIGVDTVIGQYPNKVLAGKGLLGTDTVLGPTEDESVARLMRLGTDSRIGFSTAIK
jgi:phage tail-like protein